ncbi:MAG: allophanate hydrolase subunit 1 [Rhodobacteraceae bacterium]|nr:allophanate hydrolase subunit 1 [Paracoccaceae bacterium]
MTFPRLLDAGETALVVEFGEAIDDAVSARVLALDRAFAAAPPAGVTETVPTYRSLMIHYDPLVLDRAGLVALVRARLAAGGGAEIPAARRLWRIPACYDSALAEDLGVVAAATGLTGAEVVALHSGATYRVVMYGFAPGWAYLGGLPPALGLPRRTAPRGRIPAGSLIIAGGQAIVASGAMPSGWHIIGRTPERLFARRRDPAFLVAVGDLVTFRPVDRPTHDEMAAAVAAGQVVAEAEETG